jgi:hypothetical protein
VNPRRFFEGNETIMYDYCSSREMIIFIWQNSHNCTNATFIAKSSKCTEEKVLSSDLCNMTLLQKDVENASLSPVPFGGCHLYFQNGNLHFRKCKFKISFKRAYINIQISVGAQGPSPTPRLAGILGTTGLTKEEGVNRK